MGGGVGAATTGARGEVVAVGTSLVKGDRVGSVGEGTVSESNKSTGDVKNTFLIEAHSSKPQSSVNFLNSEFTLFTLYMRNKLWLIRKFTLKSHLSASENSEYLLSISFHLFLNQEHRSDLPKATITGNRWVSSKLARQ
jgi:hypothetical protein